MRWLFLLSSFATLLAACSSSSSPAGSACAASKGTCVLGGVRCANEAPTSAQDCNPPPENPGGGFCCLDAADAAVAASTSLPACTWPANLDPPDAYTTACVASRTYLICETGDGGETRCGVNACHADEYAVSCGGPGPAQPPPLPAGCRGAVSGPSGSIAGCCPCGT